MVQIRMGAGITELSGSLSGITASRNRSGAYLRTRTKPVDPKSTSQSVSRSVFARLSKTWMQVLTDTERDSWNQYASSIVVKNKIGEDIHLTGQLMFFRTNQSRLVAGLSLISSAPVVLSLAADDPAVTFVIEGSD